MITFWAFEAAASAVIVLFAAIYGIGVTRCRGRDNAPSHAAQLSFAAGLAVMALALLPPIAAIARHLFWMQQVQSTLLRLVSPILIVLAAPGAVLTAGLPQRWRKRMSAGASDPLLVDDEPRRGALGLLTHPAAVTFLFIGAFAFWQVPFALDAAVLHAGVADLMVATLLLTSLLFWWRALDHRSPPLGPGYDVRFGMLLLATLTQIGLGAYFTLKTTALYAAYDVVGRLFHIQALNDEMQGGAIVWVPGSIICVLAAIAVFHLWGQHETRLDLRRTAWSGSNSDALLFPTTAEALVQNARPRNRMLAIGAAVFAIAMFTFVITSGVLNHADGGSVAAQYSLEPQARPTSQVVLPTGAVDRRPTR